MIFTLMSLTLSLSRSSSSFLSYFEMKFFTLILTSPPLVSACPTLSTCVIAVCKISISFFNFTPYYLLGEQNCWMHCSMRMSARREKHSWRENNPLLCSSLMAPTHRVPFGANYNSFFFFYNVMSPKESIIEQSLGIIYITVMNSSYNTCFTTPSAPYNVLWN